MYSDLFKAIFVHVPRTGGQSIEHVFLEAHGLDWKSRDPLLMRERREGERGPERLAHLLAREYVECGYLTPGIFASCFKFAIVRHPYERALSEYRYRMQKRNFAQKEFLRLLESSDREHHFAAQSEFVLDESGRTMVDCILRFESLQRDFDPVSERLFGRRVTLSHVNRSRAREPGTKFEAALKCAVNRRYERDFDLFKYKRE